MSIGMRGSGATIMGRRGSTGTPGRRGRTDTGGRAMARGALRGAAGFTLIEILITLVIVSLVGASVISLLLEQNRFYGRNDDAIYAQQNLRAATELMASELRMASSTDLISAGPDSVVFRFDVLRAVVCDTLADVATLFVYDTVENANLSGSFIGTSYSGPYDSTFAYADGWTGTVDATGAGPKATCLALGSPAGGADTDYREVSGWTGSFAGGVPDRGSLVRKYGRLSYRFAPSTFTTGTALWRGPQELVAPFEAGAGFSYVLDDGSEQSSVSSADLERVVTIRVEATAVGEGANRFDVERAIRYDIPLRN